MAGSFLLYLIISSVCISTVQALREVQRKGGGDKRDKAKAGAEEGEGRDDAPPTDAQGFPGADNARGAGGLSRGLTIDKPNWNASGNDSAAAVRAGGALAAPNSTTMVAGRRMTNGSIAGAMSDHEKMGSSGE